MLLAKMHNSFNFLLKTKLFFVWGGGGAAILTHPASSRIRAALAAPLDGGVAMGTSLEFPTAKRIAVGNSSGNGTYCKH